MKHQEIIESLPWYVSGTLSPEERTEVAQHLAGGCKECTQEVASLNALRKVVVAVGDEGPEPSPFLLNRALAEIEDYERGRAKQAEKAPSWLQRRSAAWEDWWAKTPVFARMALAVQMALLLAVGSFAGYQYSHPEQKYEILSAPHGQGNGATIGVMFNENASEREIRQVLQEINGAIVGGPSAQRIYTIELKSIPQGNTAEVEKVLQKLRQNKRVVALAQAVQ